MEKKKLRERIEEKEESSNQRNLQDVVGSRLVSLPIGKRQDAIRDVKKKCSCDLARNLYSKYVLWILSEDFCGFSFCARCPDNGKICREQVNECDGTRCKAIHTKKENIINAINSALW